MNRSSITQEVRNFYNQYPCGTDFIFPEDGYDKEFFKRHDEFRYTQNPSLHEIIDDIDVKDKRILEIGMGLGSDAQKIVERGGIYNGIDLTPASVAIVKKRFEVFGLEFESITEMNAVEMTFPSDSFDVVYANGVLLTSPKIEEIVTNIFRVIKKKGIAVIMLYHKNSLNYYISISIIRRLGIFLLYIPFVDQIVSKLTGENIKRLNKHKKNLQQYGISYLRMKNFIHRATDGPFHPYSSVWTKKMCNRLFSNFSNIEYKVRLINKRHFPFVFDAMPHKLENFIEKKWGWSLWIKVRK